MNVNRAQAESVNPLISACSKIDSLNRIKAAVCLLGYLSSGHHETMSEETQRGLALLTEAIRAALTYEIENAEPVRNLRVIKPTS